MVQITIHLKCMDDKNIHADNNSHKSETGLPIRNVFKPWQEKTSEKIFFSLKQNTITLNRICMFRLWSNKQRTACTVQLTEYGRHAAFHSVVELPLKYQSHHLYMAGRQAGRQR